MQSQLSGSGMLLGFIERQKMVLERRVGGGIEIQTSPLTSTPLQKIHFKDNA